MVYRTFVIAVCFIIASAVSSSVAQRSSRAAQGKQKPVADEIVRLRTEWAKNLQSKQIDPLAALYAPDAVYLQPSGARFSGRHAIREVCKKIMDNFTSEITFQSLASDHSGDLAYDSGEYRESLVKLSDKTEAQVQGNYVMIFKRQADGTWLIAEQVWTLVTPSSE